MTAPRSRRIAGAAVVVVLVAVAIYWFFGRGALRRSDLDLLPVNTSLVVVADVDAVLSSSLGETIRDLFPEGYQEFADEMRREFGFGPDRVAQIVVGGDVDARMPTTIVVLKDSLDEEGIARIVDGLSIDPTVRDVAGHKVWGHDEDRIAVGWVRSEVLIFGTATDVVRALSSGDKRPRSKLVDLLVSEAGLDASLAVAFDWTAVKSMRRELDRGLGGVAPLLAKHVGPVVAEVSIDSGITASAKLLDAGRRVVATYEAEVDGDFLTELLGDLSRLATGQGRRRPASDRPARTARPAEMPRVPLEVERETAPPKKPKR